jgi:hypothetical protein
VFKLFAQTMVLTGGLGNQMERQDCFLLHTLSSCDFTSGCREAYLSAGMDATSSPLGDWGMNQPFKNKANLNHPAKTKWDLVQV